MLLIQPKRAARRDRRPATESGRPSVAAVSLALMLQPLGELVHWQAVGVLLQEIGDAARGQGGLTRADVARSHLWLERWTRLLPELRTVYVAGTDPEYAHAETIGAVLYAVLQGGPKPEGWQLGRVHQLYRELHGCDPGMEVAPLGHHHRRSEP